MQTGSMINLIYSGNEAQPVVGGPATILCWTDRHAATVVAVEKDGRVVVVQEDKAHRVDTNGMSDSQVYNFERDPEGALTTFKRTRAGKYTSTGRKDDGNRCVFGGRSHYYDYSF